MSMEIQMAMDQSVRHTGDHLCWVPTLDIKTSWGIILYIYTLRDNKIMRLLIMPIIYNVVDISHICIELLGYQGIL